MTFYRQTRARPSPATAPLVRARTTGGTQLDAATLQTMQSRFGADFSEVRVHTDAQAGEEAAALGAKAFASGEHVVFAPGRYRPGSTEGNRLIAHELAHVAQQRQGGGAPASAEHQARQAADTVAGGGRVEAGSLGGADPGIHRDPVDDKKEKPPWTPGSPLPKFQLGTTGLLDWQSFQHSFGTHAQRLTLRDAGDIEREARRIAEQLALFGIGPGFKLGPFTRDDIVNLGIGKQLDDRLGRENPNSWDRMNQQWDQAHPGGFKTPILSKTWKF
jgi:hypothetical protein